MKSEMNTKTQVTKKRKGNNEGRTEIKGWKRENSKSVRLETVLCSTGCLRTGQCEGGLKLSYSVLLTTLLEVATHWEQCACRGQKDRPRLLGSLLLKGLNAEDPLVACVSTQWPLA